MTATSADVIAFRNRFPELSASPDADVAACINTADIFVDIDSYIDRHAQAARMFFAAWLLDVLRVSSNSIAGIRSSTDTTSSGPGTDTFISSIKIGERQVSFSQRQAFTRSSSSRSTTGPGEDLLGFNVYGLLFLQLRHRNSAPIMVV